MSSSVDAAQVQEVLRTLELLGYRDPSAEDVALTLHHLRQSSPNASAERADSFPPPSASPPRHVNDTIGPAGEEPFPPSASPHWRGLSSHSIRGGRTTPMNSTGTGGRAAPTPTAHVTPPARLERHLKRYERGLKALYVIQRGEAEDGAMETRPRRAASGQQQANIIYSFTGDNRYKYRGGVGAPLSEVLGPNGSTLRRRADPVRRGQQMRELWERDRFLAQQERREDRWWLQPNMNA